jgi:monothiol glutaredoxin
MTDTIDSQLSDLVRSDKVVLFMKGNRQFPQCGFSATVVGILDQLVPSYKTVNVLSDPAIRDGIKVYSKWPTIPQLYVNGEFVGGCDIIRDMFEAGELQTLLGVRPAETKIPKVMVTEAAAKAFKDAADGPEDHPRVQISAKFEYELFLDKKEKGDVEAEAGGLTFLFDAASARRADGMSIDFVIGEGGGGFKIENPQEPPKVRPLAPKALQEMLTKMKTNGEKLQLFDVRSPAEREIAKIEPSRLLDDPGQDYLAELPRDTTLVFYCHHGIRSRAAAEHFLREGFKKIYNVEGGIDAWSKTVDPSVPKY